MGASSIDQPSSSLPGAKSESGKARKIHFCFTLDTEPDNLWEPFTKLEFDHFAHLYNFHTAMTNRGAKPVYLTTSEVAQSKEAARVMDAILSTGKAELGAHYHSWTRDWPFEMPPLGKPPLQAMAHQLGQPLEEKMLSYTCNALEKSFGVRPRSYRGGRWSFNQDSLVSLRNSGILVDTTVTPGRTWQDPTHPLLDGPDYRKHPRHPYYLRVGSSEPFAESGDILELPVGAGYVSPGRLGSMSSPIGTVTRKVFNAMKRPHGWLWLRPTSMTRQQMRACLETLQRDNIPVWVAMIHSSEIVPCQKFPTQQLVDQFIQRCLQLVEDAVQMGATCSTLEEVRQDYGHAA